MINEADKKYTIIKIKVTETNQVFTVKSGYVYWWGEGARIDSPKPADQSHTYTEIGEYLVYIKKIIIFLLKYKNLNILLFLNPLKKNSFIKILFNFHYCLFYILLYSNYYK